MCLYYIELERVEVAEFPNGKRIRCLSRAYIVNPLSGRMQRVRVRSRGSVANGGRWGRQGQPGFRNHGIRPLQVNNDAIASCHAVFVQLAIESGPRRVIHRYQKTPSSHRRYRFGKLNPKRTPGRRGKLTIPLLIPCRMHANMLMDPFWSVSTKFIFVLYSRRAFVRTRVASNS